MKNFNLIRSLVLLVLGLVASGRVSAYVAQIFVSPLIVYEGEESTMIYAPGSGQLVASEALTPPQENLRYSERFSKGEFVDVMVSIVPDWNSVFIGPYDTMKRKGNIAIFYPGIRAMPAVGLNGYELNSVVDLESLLKELTKKRAVQFLRDQGRISSDTVVRNVSISVDMIYPSSDGRVNAVIEQYAGAVGINFPAQEDKREIEPDKIIEVDSQSKLQEEQKAAVARRRAECELERALAEYRLPDLDLDMPQDFEQHPPQRSTSVVVYPAWGAQVVNSTAVNSSTSSKPVKKVSVSRSGSAVSQPRTWPVGVKRVSIAALTSKEGVTMPKGIGLTEEAAENLARIADEARRRLGDESVELEVLTTIDPMQTPPSSVPSSSAVTPDRRTPVQSFDSSPFASTPGSVGSFGGRSVLHHSSSGLVFDGEKMGDREPEDAAAFSEGADDARDLRGEVGGEDEEN